MDVFCCLLYSCRNELLTCALLYELSIPWVFMEKCLAIYLPDTRFFRIRLLFRTFNDYRFLPKPIAFSIFLRVF